MDALTLLQQQLQNAHRWFEGTVADVTPEQAAWIPPGVAHSIGSRWAHLVVAEDVIVNSIAKGGAPLYASSWEGKTGISDPQMRPTLEWAQRVQVDVDQLREYNRAVFAATDDYFASLSDADVDRIVPSPLGEMPLAIFLSVLVIGHAHDVAGEISATKGLLGAKGYPA